LKGGVRLYRNTCGGNLRVISVAAPSNSPAQGLDSGQIDALRISFAMGIDLWVGLISRVSDLRIRIRVAAYTAV
jgi:hypothetical protein